VFLEDLFPHLPEAGPPVPSFLPKWPWVKEGSLSNPGSPVLVDYEAVDSRVEELREAKKSEWLAKGYRPGLVNMALEWADNWVEGLLRSPLYAFLTKEQKKSVVPGFYKYGLEKAEDWLRAMSI